MGTTCMLLLWPPQVRSKTINEVLGYANPTAKSGGYTYSGAVLFISLAGTCVASSNKDAVLLDASRVKTSS